MFLFSLLVGLCSGFKVSEQKCQFFFKNWVYNFIDLCTSSRASVPLIIWQMVLCYSLPYLNFIFLDEEYSVYIMIAILEMQSIFYPTVLEMTGLFSSPDFTDDCIKYIMFYIINCLMLVFQLDYQIMIIVHANIMCLSLVAMYKLRKKQNVIQFPGAIQVIDIGLIDGEHLILVRYMTSLQLINLYTQAKIRSEKIDMQFSIAQYYQKEQVLVCIKETFDKTEINLQLIPEIKEMKKLVVQSQFRLYCFHDSKPTLLLFEDNKFKLINLMTGNCEQKIIIDEGLVNQNQIKGFLDIQKEEEDGTKSVVVYVHNQQLMQLNFTTRKVFTMMQNVEIDIEVAKINDRIVSIVSNNIIYLFDLPTNLIAKKIQRFNLNTTVVGIRNIPSFYILQPGEKIEGKKRNFLIGPISVDDNKKIDNIMSNNLIYANYYYNKQQLLALGKDFLVLHNFKYEPYQEKSEKNIEFSLSNLEVYSTKPQ